MYLTGILNIKDIINNNNKKGDSKSILIFPVTKMIQAQGIEIFCEMCMHVHLSVRVFVYLLCIY